LVERGPLLLLLALERALVPEFEEADSSGRYSQAAGQNADPNEPIARRDETDLKSGRSGQNSNAVSAMLKATA
jgi:hypothetical protein